MSAKGLIDSAVEHLRSSASVKTVYGDPVHVDGRTFIPVAKVRAAAAPADDKAPPAPAAAKPIGVVEIGPGEAKFVSFGQTKRLAWAAAIGSAFGVLAGMILGRRGADREG